LRKGRLLNIARLPLSMKYEELENFRRFSMAWAKAGVANVEVYRDHRGKIILRVTAVAQYPLEEGYIYEFEMEEGVTSTEE